MLNSATYLGILHVIGVINETVNLNKKLRGVHFVKSLPIYSIYRLVSSSRYKNIFMPILLMILNITNYNYRLKPIFLVRSLPTGRQAHSW